MECYNGRKCIHLSRRQPAGQSQLTIATGALQWSKLTPGHAPADVQLAVADLFVRWRLRPGYDSLDDAGYLELTTRLVGQEYAVEISEKICLPIALRTTFSRVESVVRKHLA